MMPIRVRLSRARGWRLPPNTKKVDRTTRYGNPARVFPPDGRSPWLVAIAGGCMCNLVDDHSFSMQYDVPVELGDYGIKCETQHQAHEVAVRLFRRWLTHPDQAAVLDQVRRELAGLDLACWCSLD